MFSSKETKIIGEIVCGKPRRKPEQTDEEKTKLMMIREMMIREVYHECGEDQNVCVVLPDGIPVDKVFDNFYASIKSRLARRNVCVTYSKDLTVEHIENNNVVVDLSKINVTL